MVDFLLVIIELTAMQCISHRFRRMWGVWNPYSKNGFIAPWNLWPPCSTLRITICYRATIFTSRYDHFLSGSRGFCRQTMSFFILRKMPISSEISSEIVDFAIFVISNARTFIATFHLMSMLCGSGFVAKSVESL